MLPEKRASLRRPPGCEAKDAAAPRSVMTDMIATSAKALQVKSTDCPVLIFLIFASHRFVSPEITGFLIFYSLIPSALILERHRVQCEIG
jgi:hypothetical protein